MHTEVIERRKSRDEQIILYKSSGMDCFSWFIEFRKKCESLLAQDPLFFIKLIKYLNRKISLHMNECYKYSYSATKLKKLIKESLPLFLYFRRYSLQYKDRSWTVYLEQMSNLLAKYVDLELVTSKTDTAPNYDEISSRIVTYFKIYLDDSEEYLLDTILKVQLVSDKYHHILDAVISKILRFVAQKPETDVMYTRQLLVYRLWRRIHVDPRVKKQINANAIAGLRNRAPKFDNAFLRSQVLPRPNREADAESTKFYLGQQFDLHEACARFLQFSKKIRGVEEDEENVEEDEEEETSKKNIFTMERDQRLKNTLTPETNKLESVNNDYLKKSELNPVEIENTLSNVVYIPFAKLNNKNIYNNCKTVDDSRESSNDTKNFTNSSILSNESKTRENDPNNVVLIDLTDDGVTKIIKQPTERKKMAWLEKICRDNLKMREAAFKKKKEIVATIVKIEKQNMEKCARKLGLPESIAAEDFDDMEFKSDSTYHYTPLENLSKSDIENLKDDQTENSMEKKLNFKCSGQPTSRPSTETSPNKNPKTLSFKDEQVEMSSIRRNKKNTLHNQLEQPNNNVKKNIVEHCTLGTVEFSTEIDKSAKPSSCNNSSISSNSSYSSCLNNINNDDKVIKKLTVNSNVKKTDYYPNEQKVQEDALTVVDVEKKNNNIESHIYAREKLNAKESLRSNIEEFKINKLNDHTILSSPKITSKRSPQPIFLTVKSDELLLDNTMQKENLDNLNMLASVSSTSEKCEIRVKSQFNLRHRSTTTTSPIKNNPIALRIDENSSVNVLLTDVSSTSEKSKLNESVLEIESNKSIAGICSTFLTDVTSTSKENEIKIKRQNQSTCHEEDDKKTSTERYFSHNVHATTVTSADTLQASYLLNDSTNQNNFENNSENASAILNGETVMLLQTAPNSNYFIINKAGDNLTNGKLYHGNRDDELIEDVKNYGNMSIKHEPKQDPEATQIDYEDSHYNVYTSLQNSSTACTCVNCTYYRPVSYQTPTAPTVQANRAVQDKRNGNKKNKPTMTMDEKFCDLQSNVQQLENKEIIASKLQSLNSQLPLKKRLRLSMDYGNDASTSPITVNNYPSALMMSIADVNTEVNNVIVPQDIGAVVEIMSSEQQQQKPKGRGRKPKAVNNNQNVTKNKKGGKKKLADETVGTAKKTSKASNGKQTRASKRAAPNDPEWNPSGKRKRNSKKNSR